MYFFSNLYTFILIFSGKYPNALKLSSSFCLCLDLSSLAGWSMDNKTGWKIYWQLPRHAMSLDRKEWESLKMCPKLEVCKINYICFSRNPYNLGAHFKFWPNLTLFSFFPHLNQKRRVVKLLQCIWVSFKSHHWEKILCVNMCLRFYIYKMTWAVLPPFPSSDLLREKQPQSRHQQQQQQ